MSKKVFEGISEEIKQAFEWFISTVKGRKDVKSRVAVLASPDNVKSMSILTTGQAEFVQDAFWLAKQEPCYTPLRDYAEEMMQVSPSKGGLGREQTIRFVGALSESKILSKLGVTIGKEGREEK